MRHTVCCVPMHRDSVWLIQPQMHVGRCSDTSYELAGSAMRHARSRRAVLLSATPRAAPPQRITHSGPHHTL